MYDVDNPFAQKRNKNLNKFFKVGHEGIAALSQKERLKLIAESFLSKFEDIKSSLKSYQMPNQNGAVQNNLNEDMESVKMNGKELNAKWISLIKYWIK